MHIARLVWYRLGGRAMFKLVLLLGALLGAVGLARLTPWGLLSLLGVAWLFIVLMEWGGGR